MMKAIKVLLAFAAVYLLVSNAIIALFLFSQFLRESVKDSFVLSTLIIGSFIATFIITRDLIKSDCI